MSYLWSILLGPSLYFAGFLFDDVTADWANDLVATLLCWLQMAWCWLYMTMLDLAYMTMEEALPVMPNWLIQTAELVNYFEYVDHIVPLTESLALLVLWLPFYIVVRVLYVVQPWAG